MTAKRETVNEEYQARFAWWRFLTLGERSAFAEAEQAGDLKTVTKLQRRGRRRDRFCTWDICSYRLIIDGSVFLGGPEGREDCECAVTALDSDALFRYIRDLDLTQSQELDVFEQAATWLHDHPDRPLKEWVAADRAERKQAARVRSRHETDARVAAVAARAVEPPPPVVESSTVEEPEPEPETREAKALADFRRRGRTPRWYDEPEGFGAFWDKVF